MANKAFLEFCDFLQSEAGIALEANKEYLVSSRLNRLMAARNIADLATLIHQVRLPMNSELKQSVIDSMTTNETQWFRDSYPLQAFADEIIPTLLKDGHNSIRIWSAACSSGQEPYSLGMVIEEHRDAYRHLHSHKPDIKIVATDLSGQILQKARSGRYDKIEINRGLDSTRKKNFFTHTVVNEKEEYWELDAVIKQQVTFQQHNLLDNYVGLGKFDVIFCRNVLIYFSAETKSDILIRMSRQLKPHGYLILGSSETTSNYTDLFKMEKVRGTAVYQLK